MSWTLGQVKARVRNLLDDPEGSYLTDDFLVPLICEVYDDANSQLASTQSSWDIALVEVPGIAPGTPNLASYQTGDGPLANLTDQPLRIDWKPPARILLTTGWYGTMRCCLTFSRAKVWPGGSFAVK